MLKKTLSTLLSLVLILGMSLVQPAELIPGAKACYNNLLSGPTTAKPNELATYALNVGTFPDKPRKIIVNIEGGGQLKTVTSMPAGVGYNGAKTIEVPGGFRGQIVMKIQMPTSGTVKVLPVFEGDSSDCTSSKAEFGATAIQGPELPTEEKSAAPVLEEKDPIIGDPVKKAAAVKETPKPAKLPMTGPTENALLIILALLGLGAWKKLRSKQSS